MRIIAVDDERLALDLIVRLLQSAVTQAEVIGFTKPSAAFEFLLGGTADIAVLDVHVSGMSGIELAKKCKDLCPRLKIIFVTGYSQYALDALRLNAGGYLMKPVREEDLYREIENLQNPPPVKVTSRIRVQTFGCFEIFVDGATLKLPQEKCRECFAYLIHRRGARVSWPELGLILWEGKSYDSMIKRYTKSVVSDLIKSLRELGILDILIKTYNYIAVDVNKVDCDYYRMIMGDVSQINAYCGEYMINYSWAELTLGELIQNMKNNTIISGIL